MILIGCEGWFLSKFTFLLPCNFKGSNYDDIFHCPYPISPPPRSIASVVLPQSTEKPTAPFGFSKVDSFEKAEASTAKNRSGLTIELLEAPVKEGLARFNHLNHTPKMRIASMLEDAYHTTVRDYWKLVPDELKSLADDGIYNFKNAKFKPSEKDKLVFDTKVLARKRANRTYEDGLAAIATNQLFEIEVYNTFVKAYGADSVKVLSSEKPLQVHMRNQEKKSAPLN